MIPSDLRDRFTIITPEKTHFEDFASDVETGLTSNPKKIPCIYFYDERGSLLFEKICDLPEYYLTRAESEILEKHSGDLVSSLHPETVLAELGSGSSLKTRIIIEKFIESHDSVNYHPIDISRSMLRDSSIELLNRYPELTITSVAAEYDHGLKELNRVEDKPKLLLWLGSSIGNFAPAEVIDFLIKIKNGLNPDDHLLIGTDLQKEKSILEAAYDDASGITAEFNLNLLNRLNRELAADFKIDKFRHLAVYNENQSRIEMYLVSVEEQDVYVADLNRSIHFEKNERIHTENSYKFSRDQIEFMAQKSGFEIEKQWYDSKHYFCINLLRPL